MEVTLAALGSKMAEEVLDNVGAILDLTKGAKACFAFCSIRNRFKIWVSNRAPS